MAREGRRSLNEIPKLNAQISRPVWNFGVLAKPKPGARICINKKSEIGVKNKANQKKSRKKVPTTTSILTARSRAACALVACTNPKDSVVDIDAADVNNELAVVEYVEEIYKFYKQNEIKTQVHLYLVSQPHITKHMRAIIVDWLIEVHDNFELVPEILYLTVNLVDRFLCLKTVAVEELELLGVGAMLIACKYEGFWVPEVHEIGSIAGNLYSKEQILEIEKIILGKLEWNVSVPTLYMFLTWFIKAAIPDAEVSAMAYYLSELALLSYPALIYSPSKVAASAIYTARCSLHKAPAWTFILELHTQFKESELRDCSKLLVRLHSAAAESELKAVYKKYSRPEFYEVAQALPATIG